MTNRTIASLSVSHAPTDRHLCELLLAHLAPLQHSGDVSIWTAGAISPGHEWQEEVTQRLVASDLMILLLSADYFASEQCVFEYNLARHRHESGQAIALPIVARHCDWQSQSFTDMRVLPESGQPFQHSNQQPDEGLLAEIARGVDRAVTLALVHKSRAAPFEASSHQIPPIKYSREGDANLSHDLIALFDDVAEAHPGPRRVALQKSIRDMQREFREGGVFRPGDVWSDGRYVLIEELGKGGFATVWRGFDRITETDVALRIIHPNTDPAFHKRFLQGSQTLAALRHLNLARMLRAPAWDGGYLFSVMELLPGGTLEHAALSTEFSADRIIEIGCEVGSGLAECHAHKCLHRDVTPNNILFDANDAPKLTDFDWVGRSDKDWSTRTRLPVTVMFGAPEGPEHATEAYDQYGLAATLLFCLLKRAFSRQEMNTLHTLPMSISGISNARKKVLEKALQNNPRHRYDGVPAFVAALRSASRVDPPPPPPSPTPVPYMSGPSSTHDWEPPSERQYTRDPADELLRRVDDLTDEAKRDYSRPRLGWGGPAEVAPTVAAATQDYQGRAAEFVKAGNATKGMQELISLSDARYSEKFRELWREAEKLGVSDAELLRRFSRR